MLRNQEFLVALVLLGEKRGDAVPPEWQEPMDHLCNNKKRCHTDAFASASVPVQPAALQLDFMNPDRYLVASSPCMVQLCWLEPGFCTAQVHFDCSLPDGFKRSSALIRKPCFDIKLWKGYETSTPDEQLEHVEKWSRRLQKVLSGEPNSSITAAFSDYEV